MPEFKFEPLPFDEAIKAFRDKIVLPKEQYQLLVDEVKARAFSSMQIAKADMLLDVYDELLGALEDGKTFQDFKKELKIKELGWGEEMPYRLDTIFKTNIQSMYQAGHYKKQMEVADSRPYWQYVAVMDMRTRPEHAEQDGKVYRADDPYWDVWYPPNGFNCRCTVRTLSESELEREGLSISSEMPEETPDEGFSFNPGKAIWEPDLSLYPNWLKELIAL